MQNKSAGPARILITDDEKDLRRMLSLIMKNEGYDTLEAKNGQAALGMIDQGKADVILLDLMTPGLSWLEVLREIRRSHPVFPVILITATGTLEQAAEAGRCGVQGMLTKPLKNHELVLAITLALNSPRLQSIDLRQPHTPDRSQQKAMTSPAIQKTLAEADLVAPTEFTVLITGETGAGKEVMARTIHDGSRRAAGPFVTLDCGSIPPTLIESELFGHVKGSFTGADRNRAGSFESAAGGTLFLDEICNLPLSMQVKLLRVLQERRIYRVGSCTPVELDVRILAATNENIEEMIKGGRFRQDLYYRLNEFSLLVPPLRERGEDILILARQFLDLTSDELKKQIRKLTHAAEAMLLAHTWSGNVRELRNVIRRAVLLAQGEIGPEHLGMIVSPAKDYGCLMRAARESNRALSLVGNLSFKEMVHQSVELVEREILVQTLQQTEGNMKQAARVLHIDYKTLRTKAKHYGLYE